MDYLGYLENVKYIFNLKLCKFMIHVYDNALLEKIRLIKASSFILHTSS